MKKYYKKVMAHLQRKYEKVVFIMKKWSKIELVLENWSSKLLVYGFWKLYLNYFKQVEIQL